MEIIKGGVTAAKGFEAASAAAGIKYQDRTDMALIYSEKPCKTAGTFTTNVVKAAPVKWDKAIVESGIKSQVVDRQFRYCQCLHRRRGIWVLQGDRECRSEGAGSEGRWCAGRIHWRHRNAASHRKAQRWDCKACV